jgi:hypothetical protein
MEGEFNQEGYTNHRFVALALCANCKIKAKIINNNISTESIGEH